MSQKIATLEKPARRTQAERRDESGRGLVEAAIALVAEEGVSAATFEAIGRKGGYSRGLAAQRFGSKQGFIEAVINHLHGQLETKTVHKRIDEMPGLEALLAFVDSYLRNLSQKSEGRAYFMLLSSAVADLSPVRVAFAAEHERTKKRLESIVRRGQAQGNIRNEIDATAAALMIGSQLFGVSMQLLVDPALNLDPVRKTIVTTLRTSFAAERKPRRRPK